jgi:hypothetical protein
MSDKILVKKDGFKDKGPWSAWKEVRDGHKKYFVESQASGNRTGKDEEFFDDVRLYINGNMTHDQYVNYTNKLAEFLNENQND